MANQSERYAKLRSEGRQCNATSGIAGADVDNFGIGKFSSTVYLTAIHFFWMDARVMSIAANEAFWMTV